MVRAFSKADEAIVMLSFAYPEETLSDSIGDKQRGRRTNPQGWPARECRGTNMFARNLLEQR
jgi:hypothetical protein